jgi:hypothetical protein
VEHELDHREQNNGADPRECQESQLAPEQYGEWDAEERQDREYASGEKG